MTSDAAQDPSTWINEYLDGTISEQNFASSDTWLKSSPENARTFAAMLMLDDRLRSELAVTAEGASFDGSGSQASVAAGFTPVENGLCTTPVSISDAICVVQRPVNHRDKPGGGQEVTGLGSERNGSPHRGLRSILPLVSTVLLAIIGVTIFLQSFSGSSASAAVLELERLIEKSVLTLDRTYQIRVEASASPSKSRKRNRPEDLRPPKPPLNDAVLYVREGGHFVLVRFTEQGRFITGCDGLGSWMIDSSGIARTDSDPDHFNRDVPGHEHQLSLVNIHESLEHLKQAYDVQLLPEEPVSDGDVETRLLVAIRHRKERGPRRVEITYEVASGSIRQMRFVEMPYGPDLLTVEMTLTSEEPLAADFFEHTQHEKR